MSIQIVYDLIKETDSIRTNNETARATPIRFQKKRTDSRSLFSVFFQELLKIYNCFFT